MARWLRPLVASTVLTVCLTPSAKAEGRERTVVADGLRLQYSGHLSGRLYKPHYPRQVWSQLYTTVAIRAPSGVAHRLKADPEFGPFVASDEPAISPGGRYVVLEQLNGGYVEDGEHRWWDEVDYCVFVEALSARVIRRETGGYCGGEFKGPDLWVSDTGLRVNLAKVRIGP